MPPDTKFKYCSENTFILSALIKRVTGKSTVDYLDEKMFRPLGIEKPFWQSDGEGNNAGGWGLYMKSEDLAKFFLPYLHGGKYKGEQLIPAAWVEQATAKQTVLQAFQILNNFDIPIGIEHSDTAHMPEGLPSATQWTTATDLDALRIYYRTAWNSAIRCIDLKTINFQKVKFQACPLDQVTEQPVEMIRIK